MSAVHDLTGKIFERWAVVRRDGSDVRGRAAWLCLCACGEQRTVSGSNLIGGISKSCGCLKSERTKARKTTHGHTKRSGTKRLTSKAFGVWSSMRQRCTNPNNDHYQYYGARGISVCKRWENFENFLADMGEPPPKLTLERKNNDGNYEPGNCRWATYLEQAANKRPRKDSKEKT